jgi:hypothetical protein
MKSLAKLRSVVLVYNTLFTSAVFLILWLPSDGWLIAIKGLLAVFLSVLFYRATLAYPEITLGAFLVIAGTLFAILWFFAGTPIGYVLGVVWLLWIFQKYYFIKKVIAKSV